MKKILFLIHDLGHGGAEKVLVNLVNNMDPAEFDISVTALFGGGVNEQFLKPHVHYRAVFPKEVPGNSHMMKLLSPLQLHRICVEERYDIEVSYLEGPSARVVSGCEDPDTKKVCWIHTEMKSQQKAVGAFRSFSEAVECYNAFHKIVCVSQTVREDFQRLLPVCVPVEVLYNTNESEKIREMAREEVEPDLFRQEEVKLVGVGKLVENKGFHRLVPMVRRLREDGHPVHLYLLGVGPEQERLEKLAEKERVSEYVTFLGYRTNPYKYVARCDLFVCASYAEGFSTAATEALIVGTPVCTAKVSGMEEMLGENNEWGIVTENSDEGLYAGIRGLLDNPGALAHYREMAAERGNAFSTENTVKAVETMLGSL